MTIERFYLTLADLVLVIHFAFVAFVVLGLVLVWLGWIFHWRFVRNIWFRLAHLAAIGIVAVESLAGFICPLTTWENELRSAGGEEIYHETFIQHWVGRLMFFDLGPRVFMVIYVSFFSLVMLSFWLVPPSVARRAARR